ncbi:MAG: hypothetical protein ACNA7W_05960 [Pseudomonadales bacterium]
MKLKLGARFEYKCATKPHHSHKPARDNADVQRESDVNQTKATDGRIWQGTLAALLLALVLFSEAIIGAEPERLNVEPLALPPCDTCARPTVTRYSAPQPSTTVFWWRDGYACASPCLD